MPVYVTEQVAIAPLPLSVQLAAGVNDPPPLVLKLAAPLGVIGVPGELSVTVALHVVGPFSMSGLGVQLTLVEVERLLTVSAKLPELLLVLPRWNASPP